jgi:hypothetical protein
MWYERGRKGKKGEERGRKGEGKGKLQFVKICAEFCHQRHHLYDCEFKFGYCLYGYGVKNYHCSLQNSIDDENNNDFLINVTRQCLFLKLERDYVLM